MTRRIAEHEVAHALAALVAVELRCPDRWADTQITLEISAKEGACVAEIGDVIDSPGDHHLSQQIAAVSALGACVAAPDAVSLIKSENWDALAEAGQLSQEDLDLLARAEMPDLPILAARVVVAVRALTGRLGVSGWQRLCKACRDMSNARLGALRAEELCPRRAVQEAIREADQELAGLLGSVSPGEAQVAAILARAEAHEEAARINEQRRQTEARNEARRQARLVRKEVRK